MSLTPIVSEELNEMYAVNLDHQWPYNGFYYRPWEKVSEAHTGVVVGVNAQ